MVKRKPNERARKLADEHAALAGLGREIRPAPSAETSAAAHVPSVPNRTETVVTINLRGMQDPEVLFTCVSCDAQIKIFDVPIFSMIPASLSGAAYLAIKHLPVTNTRNVSGAYFCPACADTLRNVWQERKS